MEFPNLVHLELTHDQSYTVLDLIKDELSVQAREGLKDTDAFAYLKRLETKVAMAIVEKQQRVAVQLNS